MWEYWGGGGRIEQKRKKIEVKDMDSSVVMWVEGWVQMEESTEGINGCRKR